MKKHSFVGLSILVCMLAGMVFAGCKSKKYNSDISGLWWRGGEVLKIDVKNNAGTATNYYDETATPEKIEITDLCKITWTESGDYFCWYIEPSEDGIIVHTGPSPFEDDEDIQVKYTGEKVSDICKLKGTWVNNSHMMETSLTFNYNNNSIIQKIDGEQFLKAKYACTPLKRVTFNHSSDKVFLIDNGNILYSLYEGRWGLYNSFRLSALSNAKNGNLVGTWKTPSMWGEEEKTLTFKKNKDGEIMVYDHGDEWETSINQADTFMFLYNMENDGGIRYMQLTEDGFLLGDLEEFVSRNFRDEFSGRYVGKKVSNANNISGIYKYDNDYGSFEFSFEKGKMDLKNYDEKVHVDYTIAPCTIILQRTERGECSYSVVFLSEDTILVDGCEVYMRSPTGK